MTPNNKQTYLRVQRKATIAADGCRHGFQRRNHSLGLRNSDIATTIASPARHEQKSSQRVFCVPESQVRIRYSRCLCLIEIAKKMRHHEVGGLKSRRALCSNTVIFVSLVSEDCKMNLKVRARSNDSKSWSYLNNLITLDTQDSEPWSLKRTIPKQTEPDLHGLHQPRPKVL